MNAQRYQVRDLLRSLHGAEDKLRLVASAAEDKLNGKEVDVNVFFCAESQASKRLDDEGVIDAADRTPDDMMSDATHLCEMMHGRINKLCAIMTEFCALSEDLSECNIQ